MKVLKNHVVSELVMAVVLGLGSLTPAAAAAAEPSCHQQATETYLECRAGGGSTQECQLLARQVYLLCIGPWSLPPVPE